ncbi:MAG TPA: hypothetical protein DCQ37_20565 [Desulfobacteraceae bacterium]|nr:hypothetical protein [Desulfobacteraceae bacterium]
MAYIPEIHNVMPLRKPSHVSQLILLCCMAYQDKKLAIGIIAIKHLCHSVYDSASRLISIVTAMAGVIIPKRTRKPLLFPLI